MLFRNFRSSQVCTTQNSGLCPARRLSPLPRVEQINCMGTPSNSSATINSTRKTSSPKRRHLSREINTEERWGALFTVPTGQEKQGVFASTIIDPSTGQPFPNNTIPPDRISGISQKFLQFWPEPNV